MILDLTWRCSSPPSPSRRRRRRRGRRSGQSWRRTSPRPPRGDGASGQPGGKTEMNGLWQRNEAAGGGQSLFLGYGVSEADLRFKNEGGRKGRVRLRTDGRGGGCLFLLLFAFSLVVSRPFPSREPTLPSLSTVWTMESLQGGSKRSQREEKRRGRKSILLQCFPSTRYTLQYCIIFFFKRGLDLEEHLFLRLKNSSTTALTRCWLVFL